MSKPIPASHPPVSDHERHLAAAMHIAEIFFPLFAPAIAYAISGRSKFLKAHAYQALFETIVLNVCLFVVGAVSLTYTIVTLWHFYKNDWAGFSIWPMIARFAIGWILLGVLEIINTLISVRHAHKALHGEWPKRGSRKAIGNQ